MTFVPPDGESRLFRLTRYFVVAEEDYALPPPAVPVLDPSGKPIAAVRPAFFARMACEGTGKLQDGRLLNVTGHFVKVDPAVYAPLLQTVEQLYPGRPTKIGGIIVQDGQVEQISAFADVPHMRIGIGYGVQHGTALIPFRTVAADIGAYPDSDSTWRGKGGLVPLGTRAWIRELAGRPMPDGSTHDGWVTVNDTGGAIKGVHFDWFTGTAAGAKAVADMPGHVMAWFPGIADRIPAGYAYGLAK